MLRERCGWLRLTSLGGLSRLLERLEIHYKRGRDHVHSPDPDYLPKRATLQQRVAEARDSAGRVVAVYQDELTYYRQPTLARAYEAAGPCQPYAERSQRTNTATRVTGALNVLDGRVCWWQGSRLGVPELVRFYQQLCASYPEAERIYLLQDNWPVHAHADLLVALEPQEGAWLPRVPGHWPTAPSAAAVKRWGELRLPIQIVTLPTYASWTNPIEKLWRWLKQAVLHLHRLADDLARLRLRVGDFLTRFAGGSQELLRYVGLLVPT